MPRYPNAESAHAHGGPWPNAGDDVNQPNTGEPMYDLDAVVKREAAFQMADAQRENTLRERNDAVLAAVEQGATQDAVAQRLGITPARVSQIVKRARYQRGLEQQERAEVAA